MLLEGSNASTVLTWVRPDLDKHLGQIRAQIEHLAQSAIIGDGIENTTSHLEQLKFTFEALVLQGATLVVEEMITVCKALKKNRVRDRRKAFGALMDAIVVLPSYLDRLQAGHHDLPVLLLPVINELREAYDANIVSEATLFTPDLDVPLPELDRGTGEHEPVFDESVSALAMRMRRQWENALLKWLQSQDNQQLLRPLISACETLQQRLERKDLRRLWWIAAKVIGGLLDGVTDNDMHLRRLFARLHLVIKTLAEGGEDATDSQSIDAVSQALLFHVAQAKSGSEQVDGLRQRFNLQDLIPDRDVLIRARGAVTGRNRELYASLGSAVRDELSMVKDALDLELRTGQIEPERREQSHEALLRLKDTLKMMGLADSARSIDKLMPAFDASETPGKSEGDSSRQSLLMALAGELIRIESDIEEQIATLGEPLAEDPHENFIDLPPHEIRRIRSHLLDETVFSLHQVQDAVRRHFSGETQVDYTSPMEHIAGALELVGEKDIATLATKLRNALENLLRVARSETAMDPDKLENVTDAVAAFELYLAGCRDQQENRKRFLEILKDRLDHLPVGEMEVVRHEQSSSEQDTLESSESAIIDTPVPAKIDPELLGVFLEEYNTVESMLGERIPQWLQAPENNQYVTEIRRGFHTLKGSGRMVGAYEVGDFAWHTESMLNGLLEGNIDAIDQVITMVQLAHASLPELKNRLLQKASSLDKPIIEAISAQSKSLAEGQSCDWSKLAKLLPESIGKVGPDGFVAASKPSHEPSLKELLIKELSEHLGTLREMVERISRDHKTTATEDELRAIHSIAGTTALEPLSRESDIARVMESFLEAQSKSKEPFSNDAIWLMATSLGHFESCQAIHEGVPEAALTEDEDGLFDKLNELKAEYQPAATIAESAESESTSAAEAETDDESTEAVDEIDTEQEIDEVDAEILAIFLEEANDILERCDSMLNRWRDDLFELSIVRNLQRELHTFKGGSRMSGLSAMGTLSHTMESLLESIAGKERQPSEAAIDLLEQACDKLNSWTEEAAAGRIPKGAAVLKSFKKQIQALTDPTIHEKVASDTATSTPEAPQEQSPDLTKAEAEDSKAIAADDDAGIDIAIEPSDDLAKIEKVEASPEEPLVADDSAKTEEETKASSDAGSMVEEPAAAKEIPDQAMPAPKPEPIPRPPAPVAPAPPPQDLHEIPDVAATIDSGSAPAGETATSQQIRVNADLLDSLVNSAGEISIFRSLLEQQVVQMRDHLKEFDVTTARLREQFRKLEIETETQIRSRYQQEAPEGAKEFDPLELDRFSSLQQLSRSLSESVSDLLNLQEMLEETARRSDALLVQQSRVSSDLQEGLMQTRMVHFGTIAPRLRRIIRIASKETNKKARLQLRMTGSGDQLDRNVLERITAPLEHLLRNAIAHGIEKPAVRKKLNKPVDGQLKITVAAEATEFVIRVEDDGAGINRKAILKRATETGLIDKHAKPTSQQLLQMILHSGFTTSKKVTALAGRGVGMDVVSSEVKQIGGSIEIESEEGKGSCFIIRIPFTLAVMQAVGIMAGEHHYLIPVVSVAGVTRLMPAEFKALLEQETPSYEFAGENYNILELEPLLGEPTTPLGDETISMLMIKTGEQRAAFRVSELLGHREVVVKPIGPQITSVPGILGGAVTGDGKVVVIIDAGPLIRQALINGARPAPAMSRVDKQRLKALAMVVDDSITMRRVTTRVLENNDFEVITARDGVEATEILQDRVPDVILLDVEMPRMDGYQVAEWVRADTRLRQVPIVMITSRAGKKHRSRGLQAGANSYISKPYKEAELIKEVEKLMDKREHGKDGQQ